MKNNHGKVGKALYVRMTKENFEERLNKQIPLETKQLNPDELGFYGVASSIPVHISDDVEGNYEVVCEQGIEIW